MDYQRVSLPDVHTYPRQTGEIPDVRMVFKYIRAISHPRSIAVRPTVDHVSLQKRNGSGTIQSTVDLSRDGLRLRDLFFCSSRIGCFVYDMRDAQIMI